MGLGWLVHHVEEVYLGGDHGGFHRDGLFLGWSRFILGERAFLEESGRVGGGGVDISLVLILVFDPALSLFIGRVKSGTGVGAHGMFPEGISEGVADRGENLDLILGPAIDLDGTDSSDESA